MGPTTSWSPFPPLTRELQFDERYGAVHTQPQNLAPGEALARKRGECWGHVAFDPEHSLVLQAECDRRTQQTYRQVAAGAAGRLRPEVPLLVSGDDFPKLKAAVKHVFGERGRTSFVALDKEKEGKRVVRTWHEVLLGSLGLLCILLVRSKVSRRPNTSLVERHNGTMRGKNSREVRETQCFSKEWEAHRAAFFFAEYSYNFCWPVRTLPKRFPGRSGPLTPAMTAGLADHVWTIEEWASRPTLPA